MRQAFDAPRSKEAVTAPAVGRAQASPGELDHTRHRVNPLWQSLATQPSSSAGARLPEGVRAGMERSFGWDFSTVRVHQDQRAASIGARAYTRGVDVHFAPGEYAPQTATGRALLGHELAHVTQQASGRVRATAQAKGGAINDDPALEAEADRLGHQAAQDISDTNTQDGGESTSTESLEDRLHQVLAGGVSKGVVQRKVQMPPNSDLPSFHEFLIKAGDIYSYPHLDRTKDLSLEVFTSLFNSPRIFRLQGDNGSKAEYHLMRHMEARRGVVDFAGKKKYTFTGGRDDFKMNPKYWEIDKERGKFWKKEGVEWDEAHRDINEHPEEYRIGCAAASKVTIEGGGGAKQASGTTGDDKDWVPGDGGFIKNDGWDGSAAGLEGENIIYVGLKRYWGHFNNTVAIQPYTKWYEMVQGWNNSATLQPDRQWPSKGLKG